MAKVLDLNKSELSENEVLLLMRRINSGMIKPSQVPHFQDGEGYKLTPEQSRKGLDWLKNKWKTPNGKERSDNPFGYREEQILEKSSEIRLKDVYSPTGRYYYPYYEVLGNDTSFEYYVEGGKINILG